MPNQMRLVSVGTKYIERPSILPYAEGEFFAKIWQLVGVGPAFTDSSEFCLGV